MGPTGVEELMESGYQREWAREEMGGGERVGNLKRRFFRQPLFVMTMSRLQDTVMGMRASEVESWLGNVLGWLRHPVLTQEEQLRDCCQPEATIIRNGVGSGPG